MEEKAISPAESLQIIEKMLADTRNRFYNNGFAFLFWGILVITTCILAYIMDRMNIHGMDGYIWSISVAFGILVTAIYFARIAPRKRGFTRLDSINGKVWIAYGISYMVLMYLCSHFHQFAPPFIYCLLGMGMFATGGIYKFWSLYAGAFIFWLGAIACTLVELDINQYLISIAVMFLGYLIPGYILWKKAKKEAHV